MLKFIGKKGMPLLLTALLSITAWAQTPAQKTIHFATEATYPPFESIDPSGKIQGFDMDVVNAICQKIQVQCVFENVPFDSLIPSLQTGKFDAIVSAIDITPERSKQVDFTQPYYVNTAIFVAAKTANFDITPAGLKGKTIGAQQGTTLGTYLQTHYDNTITLKTYPSVQDALLDLQAGRVDAVFSDTPVVVDWIKKYGKDAYKTLGEPINDPRYFGAGYGIAVRQGNTWLLGELNQGLAAIKKDGSLDKLIKQRFGQ